MQTSGHKFSRLRPPPSSGLAHITLETKFASCEAEVNQDGNKKSEYEKRGFRKMFCFTGSSLPSIKGTFRGDGENVMTKSNKWNHSEGYRSSNILMFDRKFGAQPKTNISFRPSSLSVSTFSLPGVSETTSGGLRPEWTWLTMRRQRHH